MQTVRSRFLSLLSLSFLFAVAAACTSEESEVKIVDASMVDVDLLKPGPNTIKEYEYATPATVDPEISPLIDGSYPIDIRGRLFLPENVQAAPLLVFLHGNHSTCGSPTGTASDPRLDNSEEYARSGTCPSGYVEAPSYRGYDPQARLLASHGYVVISINANRGINGLAGTDSDPLLVYARGLLVLKHLEQFANWSKLPKVPGISPSLDLRNKIDWSEIGFMGHSRGGEGVRYAYNILNKSADSVAWRQKIPGVEIRGIFEVAPIDYGSKLAENLQRADAQGLPWTVLIPGCDTDVSDYSGINPYMRMSEQSDGFAKSIFTLWGANHNFFNSEWQVSDAPHSCGNQQTPLWDTSGPDLSNESYAKAGLKGSKIQQDYLKALMLAFFRAHVGQDRWEEGEHVFDPQYHLPSQLAKMASSSREFIRSGDGLSVFDSLRTIATKSAQVKIETLETFAAVQFDKFNEWNQENAERGFDQATSRFTTPKRTRTAWVLTPVENVAAKVEIPFSAPRDPSGYWTLDIVLAKYEFCTNDDSGRCSGLSNDSLQIELVYADGTVSSPVYLREYLKFDKTYPPLFFLSKEKVNENERSIERIYGLLSPIFQTARFEITDFGPSAKEIRGVNVRFPAATSYSLLINKINLTRKSPAPR